MNVWGVDFKGCGQPLVTLTELCFVLSRVLKDDFNDVYYLMDMVKQVCLSAGTKPTLIDCNRNLFKDRC